MFLFIDESEEGSKKIVGGLLIPTSKVGDLESCLANERIKSKLFGEVKWSSISGVKYHQAYLDVLNIFWNETEATFHSCSYRRVDDRYKAAYMLIRAVSWKIENHCKKQGVRPTPMYVLFDNGGSFGTTFFPRIKTMLARDQDFHLSLEFCNHGHSHVMGGLQIADVLAGATASRINATHLTRYPQNILDEIERKNGGQVGVIIPRFPRLYEFKMHHFDLIRLRPTV